MYYVMGKKIYTKDIKVYDSETRKILKFNIEDFKEFTVRNTIVGLDVMQRYNEKIEDIFFRGKYIYYLTNEFLMVHNNKYNELKIYDIVFNTNYGSSINFSGGHFILYYLVLNSIYERNLVSGNKASRTISMTKEDFIQNYKTIKNKYMLLRKM